MTSRQKLLLVVLVCSALTTACIKEIAKSLSNVVIVRNEIVKKFGDAVDVNAAKFGNQTTLRVTFVNSALNDESRQERAKRALETAEVVKLHYPEIRTLSATQVSFVRQKTYFAVFHQNEALDMFIYDRDARPLSKFEGRSTPIIDLETKATYLEHSNESDVSVYGLQLEGEPGAGLTLIPHFTVSGNANEKAASPPSVVQFDLASFAEEEKFSGLVTFKFIVEGQTAVSTKGQFSPFKPPDSTGQFCYLKFPYKAFQRMLSGDSLTIVIDEDSYELTAEQFEALKELTDYIKE